MAFGRLGALGGGFGHIGAGGGVDALAGGGLLLVGETDGFAADFTDPVDRKRIAVKTAGAIVSSGVDTFFQNAGLAPKQVFDSSGTLVWAAHNLFTNSAAPVTGNFTTIVGETYTVTIAGSGSMTASVGGSGVATQAAPLVFVATGTSTTLTKAGTVTQIQANRGAVATAYLATAGSIRCGVAVDCDLITHASSMLLEVAATNLLLNTTVPLVTQSVTVTAVAHTLSFFGTGTVTLTGTSTAGPLTGTGANNRVSLTFTPTAGSLTLTVTGTVTRAQLEASAFASSPIPTWGVTQTRSGDNYTFLLSTIPSIGSAYTLYARMASPVIANNRFGPVLTDGTANEIAGFKFSTNVLLNISDGGVAVGSISQGTIVADAFISAAARIVLNDCAMSVAGAAAAFDTTVTLPTVTEIRFGGTGVNGLALTNYRIAKLVILPRAMSNAELAVRSAT